MIGSEVPRVYFDFGGGLGDVVTKYLHMYGGLWPGLKRRYPGIRIDVIGCVVNPAILELFYHHPLLETIHYIPMSDHHVALSRERGLSIGSVPWDDVVSGFDLSWTDPDVYLSAEEEVQSREIREAGSYTCVHPFAGMEHRCWAGRIPTHDVVDWIADAGHGPNRVVLLGGSSDRNDADRTTHLDESFVRDQPGLVNLVGRASVRLQVDLATRASAFVGTCSAYLAAACSRGVPSLCFTDAGMLPYREFSAGLVWDILRHAGVKMLSFRETEGIDLKKVIVFFVEGRKTWYF